MTIFLCFFVAFCAYSIEFDVPWTFESALPDGQGVVWSMRQPSHVGLEKCTVTHERKVDIIAIKSFEEEIVCEVNSCSVGGWIFAVHRVVEGERQFVGSVVLSQTSEGNTCLSVKDQYDRNTGEGFVFLDRGVSPNCRRYDVGTESFNVRKYFAEASGDSELFVSARFFYKDLKNVVVRCGSFGIGWVDKGKDIGTIGCSS